MDILQFLALLQLLAVPVFTQAQPSHDIWGDYGVYGPCSRTCGTGISMRTRRCITQRTDGGHNCVGSSKSYRLCNSQECPMGSRDFREQQCSEFDGQAFQGKRHSWVPYRGASNVCELHCVPRGGNFVYRQRAAVVDGTPCHMGRPGICVDGVCRPLVHGEFLGLDQDAQPVGSPIRAPVAPHPRDAQIYAYTIGVYGACSATCDGGMQYRSVDCVLQDPVDPRVVDETYCIAQRLQRPAHQQACSLHPCTAAKYSVSAFSACSVTCGEGEQTRQVFCTGLSGERVADHACGGLQRPQAVQPCYRPTCHVHITWHTGDFGLCTRSCGRGVRERHVGCYDADLNPYSEDRCGSTSKPVTVESCNTQPCPGTQTPVAVPRCQQSRYGCCTDGHTSAAGPGNKGCPGGDCIRTRYGCCVDGMTPARGFGRAGCPDDRNSVPPSPPASQSIGDICTLPRDEGPCDTWKLRFYYNTSTGKCTDFWYGSCQGNANNFASLEACRRQCRGTTLLWESHQAQSPQRAAAMRATTARAMS